MATDINVNLKAKNKNGEVAYRLLPKTLANNVTTTDDKQFVSKKEKESWNDKLSAEDVIPEEEIAKLFNDSNE